MKKVVPDLPRNKFSFIERNFHCIFSVRNQVFFRQKNTSFSFPQKNSSFSFPQKNSSFSFPQKISSFLFFYFFFILLTISYSILQIPPRTIGPRFVYFKQLKVFCEKHSVKNPFWFKKNFFSKQKYKKFYIFSRKFQ